MQCGHCGTEVKDGFTTCPACGAAYRRRPGFLAELPQYCGAPMVLFGLLRLETEQGQMFIVIGIALIIVSRIAIWETPYKWWRREP